MSTPQKYSRQKISAVLRKAGLSAAKWHASGMVRGWGDWTPGASVRALDGDQISVFYRTGRWSKAEAEISGFERICRALEDAGIPYEIRHQRTAVIGGAA